MYKISQNDFLKLANFVHQNYGIDLSKKKQLIESRLTTTLQANGYRDFTEYVKYITASASKADIDTMLNKLTTNYTFFLREKNHFDFFQNTILPYLVSTKKNKVLSIWSAGCSTGEEPYTITMFIKDYLGSHASKWDTRILATDISQRALKSAMQGEYPIESIANLPARWKAEYFKPTQDKSIVSVSKELKDNVIFRTFNLMEPIRFKIPFDVIFCRNVMIYFDQNTKNALIQRFYNATNPGGYLLIGHSESITRTSTHYQYIMPSTYRKPFNKL